MPQVTNFLTRIKSSSAEVEKWLAETNHCWHGLPRRHWQTEGLRFAPHHGFPRSEACVFDYSKPIDLESQQYASRAHDPELHFEGYR